MFRWIREIVRPSLKCDRLGHRPGWRARTVYRYPSKWGAADRVFEQQTTCRRCKAELSDWEATRESSIHSLAMPADDWDTLRRDGVLVMTPAQWAKPEREGE